MTYVPAKPVPTIVVKSASPLQAALGEHEAVDKLKAKFFPKRPAETNNTIYGVGQRKNIY